mmetsp:Transcript_21564/g.38939  ORF Transcript_21564/g.38939 Transcript_21564/m.38939 type:complete len:215 (-) Transcript_21564:860-1504(-)
MEELMLLFVLLLLLLLAAILFLLPLCLRPSSEPPPTEPPSSFLSNCPPNKPAYIHNRSNARSLRSPNMPIPFTSTSMLPGLIPTLYASESRLTECTYKPRGMREMVIPNLAWDCLVLLVPFWVFGWEVPSTALPLLPESPHALGDKLALPNNVPPPNNDEEEGDEKRRGVDCVFDEKGSFLVPSGVLPLFSEDAAFPPACCAGRPPWEGSSLAP